jgi:nitrite reductase/ring-hydroxylating ferredoxin subunit
MTTTDQPDTGTPVALPRGSARSPGRSYQDLLDADTHPVPDVLRWQSWAFIDDADVPVARYTSREFHELEKEKVWSRVWQMACREEDVPEVGDTLVYDICDWSILVVRSAPDRIQAFHNACLHRGRQLREFDGNVHELRCAFHGFCWNLDGSLKQVPCAWDFPHIDDRTDEFQLPEVRVGTWGGFVFVNMDPHCEPLEDFLGELPKHFERWDLSKRYKSVHVAKIFPTNWKVVQEAFSEAFHVVATHPQLLPGIGDANSQYDWHGNFSRAITPNGTPSPHLKWEPTEQEMFDAVSDRRLDDAPFVVIPDGMSSRQVAAAGGREMYRPIVGDVVDSWSDAEFNDSIYYTLFPNLHPWGAYNRICYRFRPYGDRHDMSIMECMYLSPYDEAEGKPPAVPIHWLGVDDDWTEAPELGNLARVFNQDSYNLPKVQRGLLAMQKPGVTLANYQETKVRHIHWLLSQWIAKD